MEHHGGLINYWNEHYGIGLFTIFLSVLYLIMSFAFINCLLQWHRQQRQISLSASFAYLIISFLFFYSLIKIHHMDLHAIIIFIIQVALISTLIIISPIILELLVYMIAAQLDLLIKFLDLLANLLGFIRTKILEFLESEFCKKPPET